MKNTTPFIQLSYRKYRIAIEAQILSKVVREAEAHYLAELPQIPKEILGKRHFRIDNNPMI